MSPEQKKLVRVQDFLQTYGVKLRLVEEVAPYWRSPFSAHLGVNWWTGIIFMQKSTMGHASVLGGLFHEMAHLLAVDVPPEEVEDERVFVVWEKKMAERFDLFLPWWYSMKYYGVGGGEEFGDLSKKQQDEWLRRSIWIGMVGGTLDLFGRPVVLDRYK